jgi:D-aminopeptidase
VPDVEVAVVKEGIGRYTCISLSAQAARDTIREAARKSVGRIGTIKPYTVKGPLTLQVEYTTRNSLPLDAELRVGAEVLDDRTIRFKGQDILEVWRLYRSRVGRDNRHAIAIHGAPRGVFRPSHATLPLRAWMRVQPGEV